MADPTSPPRRIAPPPVCFLSGISIPECSCPRCLEDQVKRFRPAPLEERGGETAEPRSRPLAA